MAEAPLPTLHYEVIGDADAPPIAFAHGFMSSNHQWELNVPRLSEHHQLVLIELAAHGQSPIPEDPRSFEVPNVLAAIDGIRASLGHESWWVCGHSMGGATMLRYGLAYPARTRGVMFTNTRAGFALPRAGSNEAIIPREGPLDLRDLPFHPIHAKRFPEDLKAKMVATADRMDADALRLVMRNRHALSCVADLGEMVPPVLMMNGRYERAFQPCIATARQALPTIEIIDLEGGHSINVEQPDAFDAAVLEFTARR